MNLFAPKTIFLDMFLLLYSELTYKNSGKGNNYYAKTMFLLVLNAIKLASSWTGHYLVAKCSQFGLINVVWVFIQYIISSIYSVTKKIKEYSSSESTNATNSDKNYPNK